MPQAPIGNQSVPTITGIIDGELADAEEHYAMLVSLVATPLTVVKDASAGMKH